MRFHYKSSGPPAAGLSPATCTQQRQRAWQELMQTLSSEVAHSREQKWASTSTGECKPGSEKQICSSCQGRKQQAAHLPLPSAVSQQRLDLPAPLKTTDCEPKLFFVFHHTPLLLLCNVSKLLAPSGSALPAPGSFSCHISYSSCSSWPAAVPSKHSSAFPHKQPLLILHFLWRSWVINQPPGSSLIGNTGKSTFFSFLKSPDKVGKFDLKSSNPPCLM